MTMNSEQVKPESFYDNVSLEREIFRNNVNIPCIKYDGSWYKVEYINANNLSRLSVIEKSNLPFVIDLENDGLDVFKCIIRIDGDSSLDDMSVVCIVHEKPTVWYCDDVNDFSVQSFKETITEAILAKSTQILGVHIVSNWEDGGSDATDLPLYTSADFHRIFPHANLQNVLRFYEGKGDGFVVRIWIDFHGKKVTDTVYYCLDYDELTNKSEYSIEDGENYLTVEMKIDSIKSLYPTEDNQSTGRCNTNDLPILL